MKIRTTFTAIVICLAVASCTSFQAYDGPPRPDSETALVQTTRITVDAQTGAQDVAPGRSFFTSVDSLDVPNLADIRVLPGDRCVTLRLVYTPTVGTTTARLNSILCFDAIAGREYEARVRIPSNRPVRTWLVDLETGDTVADGRNQAS